MIRFLVASVLLFALAGLVACDDSTTGRVLLTYAPFSSFSGTLSIGTHLDSKLNIASNQNTTYALDVNFNNHGMHWGGGFAVSFESRKAVTFELLSSAGKYTLAATSGEINCGSLPAFEELTMVNLKCSVATGTVSIFAYII